MMMMMMNDDSTTGIAPAARDTAATTTTTTLENGPCICQREPLIIDLAMFSQRYNLSSTTSPC